MIKESGVLIAPATPEEREMASLYIQVCRKYNIDLNHADEMEKEFVLARVNYLLSQKQAV